MREFREFKAGDRNILTNALNLAGLNVEKYNYKEMDWGSLRFDKDASPDAPNYPPNPSLDGYYVEPIVLKDLDTNDIYHFRIQPNKYFDTDWEDDLRFDSTNVPLEKSEAGIWELSKEEQQKQIKYFNLLLFERGRSYGDVDIATPKFSGKFISEFESFENFDEDPINYNDEFAQDPTISVAKPELDISELVASQLELGEKLLDESILNLKQLKEAKAVGDLEKAMFSVEEVDKLYNGKISTDDKRAFLIWLQNKNQRQLRGEFYEMYGSPFPTPPNVVIELMRKGKLFYVESAPEGERLQPKVIFLSGNIWKKWSSLQDESTEDKEKFVQLWGEEILELHRKVMKPIWDETWEKRLRFKGERSMRITLMPTTDMARNVVIDTYIAPTDDKGQKKNFEIYQSIKKGQLVEDLSRSKRDEEKKNNNYVKKKKIPLVTAFLLWLKDAGTGEVASKNGVQWSKTTQSYEDVRDKFISPIQNPYAKEKKAGADKWAREKDDAKRVGTRLFSEFLDKGLLANDTTALEKIWNSTYNYYRDPVLDEVPIGFTYKKYLDNLHLFSLRYANLKAIRYYLTRGSVGLAYGVGIGKTFCSIMAIKQGLDLGLADRPVVIVPNQVYFQFGQEIQRGLGSDFNPLSEDTRLNMFYNGNGIYNAKGNNAVDGINLCTYEATQNFQFVKEKLYSEIDGILEPTAEWLIRASKIMFQGGLLNNSIKLVNETLSGAKGSLFNEVDVDESVDEKEKITELAEGGKVEQKENVEPIYVNSESVDWDMVVVDEVHNFNQVFEGVKSKAKSEQTDSSRINREDNPYSSIRETASKLSSGRANKLFWLTQYVQSKKSIKNTILLSATPFTNSPTQVFSLLTLLDYDALIETKVDIMKDFYDLFAKIEYTEDFKTDLRIVKRLKLTGWVNIIAMQKLVYRLFDKSSPEEEENAVIRPKKIVLPLKRLEVDKKIIELAQENHISTTIKMSQRQKELWDMVRDYAQDSDMRYDDICNEETQNTTKLGRYKPSKESKAEKDEQTDVEDANDLTDGSQEGEKAKREAKALQCLGWGRQICLNPYLYKCSGYKTNPTPKQYVEASPKLLYTAECIRSVKNYHDENGSVVSGQIIYMNYGVDAFTLIRDYLVEEVGFNVNEIGIISGKGNYVGKKRYNNKLDVQDFFLGRTKDEETGKYKQIQDSKRVKVLLGSEAIKEGINLQDYASVLYNCFLDFNPTDQVQVEGRIWRQGNAFANVRIVIPLIADCIDIFMFQKLQDKTERINQLWTRAGNKNELDTTSFNPEELKYELMTDPRAIAILDRENKNDRIDEEIVMESEEYANYITLESIFKKKEKATKYSLDSRHLQENLAFYHNMSQLRADLFDMPYFNSDGIKKYLEKLHTIIKPKIDDFDARTYNIYEDLKQLLDSVKKNKFFNQRDGINFVSVMNGLNYLLKYVTDDLSEQPLNVSYAITSEQKNNISSMINYSREDLIEAMVKINKDQKIDVPIGYSKNWREVYAKSKKMPILEFDEVSYVAKRKSKKGIATYVSNNYGRYITDDFLDQFKYFLEYEAKEKTPLLEEAIKKSGAKIKLENLENPDYFHNNEEEEEKENSPFNEKRIKEFNKFLLWWLENASEDDNFFGSQGELINDVKPYRLDVGDSEDLNIEEKQIKLVESKTNKKKSVAPTKRPDSFKYDNKNAYELIKDGFDFIYEVAENKIDYPEDKYVKFIANSQLVNIYLDQAGKYEKTQELPLIASNTQGRYNDLKPYVDTLLGGVDNWWSYRGDEEEEGIYKELKWIEIQESFDASYGFYKKGYTQFYQNDDARAIADFKIAYKNKLEPFGLLKKSDVSAKVYEVEQRINTLKLEQKNLYTDERFEELVQEVIRKQQELAKEEIREGNSFRARAEQFARPNPEYLGNEYLDLFETRGDAKGQRYEEAVVVVEKEEVEEVEEQSSEKDKAQALIEKYNNLLKFLDEEQSEITKGYIAKLQMAMKFM